MQIQILCTRMKSKKVYIIFLPSRTLKKQDLSTEHYPIKNENFLKIHVKTLDFFYQHSISLDLNINIITFYINLKPKSILISDRKKN
jgi:hypothetical protein